MTILKQVNFKNEGLCGFISFMFHSSISQAATSVTFLAVTKSETVQNPLGSTCPPKALPGSTEASHWEHKALRAQGLLAGTAAQADLPSPLKHQSTDGPHCKRGLQTQLRA